MIAQTLKRLFEADIEADDYQETAPDYELHADLGWPPWAPMLADLWAQEDPPESMAGTAMHRDWHRYRSELMELHRQYREARS